MHIHGYLEASVQSHPSRIAVEEPTGERVSYSELNALADRLRACLVAMGVRPGDRVAICLPKSIDSVAAIHGTLKCGAAYVPLDPTAPVVRNAYIVNDCSVKATIAETATSEALGAELGCTGGVVPAMVGLGDVGGGHALQNWLDAQGERSDSNGSTSIQSEPDDLAYILYTSGSTGRPKGVQLTHGNGCSFVEWCAEVFEPDETDRFSSHAPFHFDLSILDIFTAMRSGAALVLVTERLGRNPTALARLIAEREITIWYSAPSILTMLTQFGELPSYQFPRLRIVLFAGEVFPIAHLKRLKELLPRPRYFNLYGPTETNVCTYHEIPEVIAADFDVPFPIGTVCTHLEGMIVDSAGAPVERGAEGELCIRGPQVTRGYWNLPDTTAAAFLPDSGGGADWYRTGDLVVDEGDGVLRYVGRRDRMIKKRGYRVELGEIEACLSLFEGVLEVAAVAVTDEDGVSVVAHLATTGGPTPSAIALKVFCSKSLPAYMIPDQFRFHDALPKTSTDKMDYQTLQRL